MFAGFRFHLVTWIKVFCVFGCGEDWYTQIDFWLLLLRGRVIHKMIGVLHSAAGRGSRMIVSLFLKT